MPPRPRRRSLRLPAYDYSQAGAYFITVCTQNRRGRTSLALAVEVVMCSSVASGMLAALGATAEANVRAAAGNVFFGLQRPRQRESGWGHGAAMPVK